MLSQKVSKQGYFNKIYQLIKMESVYQDDFNLQRVANSSINNGYFDGKSIQRVILYLRGKGCEWSLTENGGCYMCGHYQGTTKGDNLPVGSFAKQFREEMMKYDFSKIPMVCVYNAGSLLNKNEIPRSELYEILKDIQKNDFIKSVIIESRPEFIDEEVLIDLKTILKDKILEIGIGLETSNDTIRELCVNKGFTFNEYKETALRIKKHNIKVLTYLTVKPLFLSIQESINDVLNSIEEIRDITDIISLEPLSLQKGTLVDFLFRHHYYELPKGWLIKEILSQYRSSAPFELRVGGFEFFPIPDKFIDNCSKCSRDLYQAIDSFNRTKDTSAIMNLNCSCYNDFKQAMYHENMSLFFQLSILERIDRIYLNLKNYMKSVNWHDNYKNIIKLEKELVM